MLMQTKRIVMGLTVALAFPLVSMAESLSSAAAPSATVSQQAMLASAQKNGFYVGGSYHYAGADWANSTSLATGSGKSNSSVFSGRLGFRFNQHLAAEAGLWYFGEVEGATFKKGGDTGSISAYAFSASLKIIQPVFNHVEAYFKGGVAYRMMTLEGSAGLMSTLFGLGLEYQLNPNLSFSAGYTYLAGDGTFNDAEIGSVPAYHMLSLGMNYNFSL